MKRPWEINGRIVEDANGHPIECDNCPCNPCCADGCVLCAGDTPLIFRIHVEGFSGSSPSDPPIPDDSCNCFNGDFEAYFEGYTPASESAPARCRWEGGTCRIDGSYIEVFDVVLTKDDTTGVSTLSVTYYSGGGGEVHWSKDFPPPFDAVTLAAESIPYIANVFNHPCADPQVTGVFPTLTITALKPRPPCPCFCQDCEADTIPPYFEVSVRGVKDCANGEEGGWNQDFVLKCDPLIDGEGYKHCHWFFNLGNSQSIELLYTDGSPPQWGVHLTTADGGASFTKIATPKLADCANDALGSYTFAYQAWVCDGSSATVTVTKAGPLSLPACGGPCEHCDRGWPGTPRQYTVGFAGVAGAGLDALCSPGVSCADYFNGQVFTLTQVPGYHCLFEYSMCPSGGGDKITIQLEIGDTFNTVRVLFNPGTGTEFVQTGLSDVRDCFLQNLSSPGSPYDLMTLGSVCDWSLATCRVLSAHE